MSTPPRFCSDYGKRAAKCQKCKMQLEKGSLRLGKIQPNFFIKPKDDKPPPDMKQYFHIHCMFEMLFKARVTTKVIDTTEEIEGFDDLTAEDQDAVSKLVDELTEKRSRDGGDEKAKKTPKKAVEKAKEKGDEGSQKKEASSSEKEKPRKRKNEENDNDAKRSKTNEVDESSSFNSFVKFTKVCEVISDISDQREKSSVVTALLNKKGFDGDLVCWLNFLMRDLDSREYKVSNEKIIQYFSKILDIDESKLKEEFKKSKDVSLAVRDSVEKVRKNEKSDWSIQKVDRFLTKLGNLEEDDEIATHFKVAAKRLSPVELQYLIRLALKDLKINISNDNILRGVHKKAAEAFENDVSIEDIVKKFNNGSFDKKEKKKEKSHKKEKHSSSRARKNSESGDSDDDDGEMSESEESYVSDDDDSEEDEISDSESSDEISSSSESENEEGEVDHKENKKIIPKGTRSRPAGNVERVEIEKCPPDMEECRYGASCYRKNKQHKEDFWHPTK